MVEDFLARVIYAHADDALAVVDKCPTHCIRDFARGYPEGSSFASGSTGRDAETAA